MGQRSARSGRIDRREGFGGHAAKSRAGGEREAADPKSLELEHLAAWARPARDARFVGGRLQAALGRLGIETIEDVLFHVPARYLDMGQVRTIGSVSSGDQVTVSGTVKQVRKRKVRRGLSIASIGIFDGTGYLYGTWFNQDYVADRLREGRQVAFSGKAVFEYGHLQITQPFVDVLGEGNGQDDDRVHTSGIIPIYPATEGLSSTMIRRIMRHALDDYGLVPDPLPQALRKARNLVGRSEALADIHFPPEEASRDEARRRLVYEEFLAMQVGIAARRKHATADLGGIRHDIKGEMLARLRDALPFALTGDQEGAIEQIYGDMTSPSPMNRLLQGEVGSGKTLVAVAALLGAVEGGYQAAIMAPTEVLATQHHEKSGSIFAELGVQAVLLTAGGPSREKNRTRDRIKAGEAQVVIGTHALIQSAVDYDRLGLVIVDEQHRFGVRQRLAMREKGANPDTLVMTATPIPRTLALTLYGDLDVSVLRQLPGGRRIGEHIDTTVYDQKHRDRAYARLRKEVAAGRQAYVVCPMIEESEKIDVKAVTEELGRLREIFPDLRIGLLHGRLKVADKAAVMSAFREGDLDILLATTVIEVGVDVPNATVMIVEDAERFGLSQLHQLRGRIGRGRHRSECMLFADPATDEGKARMAAISTITDGFELAEEDMRIRGEGQLFGPRQAGLPDLRVASLATDQELLELARKDARALVEADPRLSTPANGLLGTEVQRRFAGTLEWIASG